MKDSLAFFVVVLPLYFALLYIFGLRLSPKPPFIRVVLIQGRLASLLVRAATRSALRKRVSLRDFFVYQKGAEPELRDYVRTQVLVILSFTGMMVTYFITFLID